MKQPLDTLKRSTKSLLVIVLMSLTTSLFSQSICVGNESYDREFFLNSPLPLLTITTVDGEEPTCDFIEAPPDCWGESITNATKVPGRLTIELGKEMLYDSGEYSKDNSGMTVKIRGNTSAKHEKKKPYKIKLQKKADLLRRGNESKYKDKDWILIFNTVNQINTLCGFAMNKLLGLQWTPACEYVNVVMNGKYRGLYLLTEAVKRNPDCRLNVDKNTGFIVEFDPYWWNEDHYFESSFYLKYTYKYPEGEDVTPVQREYIQETMDKLEYQLKYSTFSDMVDFPSFANWCIGHDLLGSLDAAGSNMYITKYNNSDTAKIKMGNMWDFDILETYFHNWSTVHTWPGFFYFYLFNQFHMDFSQYYVERYREVSPWVLSDLRNCFMKFLNSDVAKSIDEFSPLDTKVTGFKYDKLNDQWISKFKWLMEQKKWLDNAVEEMAVSVGIPAAPSPIIPDSSRCYDISGRPTSPDASGIIIINGQKYYRKH